MRRRLSKLQLWLFLFTVSVLGGALVSRGLHAYDRAPLMRRQAPRRQLRALLFTMDTLTETVRASKRGGPSGEIVVRKALSEGLRELGVSLYAAASDAEFEERMLRAEEYTMLILDIWTWTADGRGRPKECLKAHMNKVFLMDFFGDSATTVVPNSRILTAYPMAGGSFLGWYVDRTHGHVEKLEQGVIWGKQANYFRDSWPIVLALASLSPIHLTIPFESGMLQHENVTYRGFLDQAQWRKLLATSKYLAGLGNPLAGPSAVDAVAAGCVFINPALSRISSRPAYSTQHPYLAAKLGAPYVCSTSLGSTSEYMSCAQTALAGSFPPHIPEDFLKSAHRQRLRSIFSGFIDTLDTLRKE